MNNKTSVDPVIKDFEKIVNSLKDFCEKNNIPNYLLAASINKNTDEINMYKDYSFKSMASMSSTVGALLTHPIEQSVESYIKDTAKEKTFKDNELENLKEYSYCVVVSYTIMEIINILASYKNVSADEILDILYENVSSDVLEEE